MAVAALNKPFAMPDHYSEGRGSTFFPVSIRIGMAGMMVGLQRLDERVAKNRQILVESMGSTSTSARPQREPEWACVDRRTARGYNVGTG